MLAAPGSPKPAGEGDPAPGSGEDGRNAAFRPHEHIRRRADFERIYKLGTRVSSRYSTVFVLPNDLGNARLGIAATRKLGGAVTRNRAKRLIREVFRRNKIARGLDIVVIPKRELLDASLTVLETDYRNILERSARSRGSKSAG